MIKKNGYDDRRRSIVNEFDMLPIQTATTHLHTVFLFL